MLDVTVMGMWWDIEQLNTQGVIMSTLGGIKSHEAPLRLPVDARSSLPDSFCAK